MKLPLLKEPSNVRGAYFLLVGSIALLLSSLTGLAQTGTGAVTGTVRETDQAVLSRADVAITNSDTNISRMAATSEQGDYYFGALPPGPYTLVVEVPGFKKWSGSLVLQV